MAEVIALLDKNSKEKLRVALDHFRGTDLVDLRISVQLSQTSGAWTPTRKGVSFRQELLGDVIEALQVAQQRIRETA